MKELYDLKTKANIRSYLREKNIPYTIIEDDGMFDNMRHNVYSGLVLIFDEDNNIQHVYNKCIQKHYKN